AARPGARGLPRGGPAGPVVPGRRREGVTDLTPQPPLRRGKGAQVGRASPAPTVGASLAAPAGSEVSSIRILGVRVDDVTYDETVALIVRWIDEARAGHGSPHVVTTPNPEIVMAARRDPSFQALLGQAALNVPDGVGLLLAARFRRWRFRDHV